MDKNAIQTVEKFYPANLLTDKEASLIIEIDGGQHNTPENILTDAQRTQFLQSKGYKVIRFWNNEIDNNIEGVYLELENQYQEITK